MILNDYNSLLTVGIDVDWLKTSPGRTTYQKAKADGVSFPALFKQRGFDHVRLRVKEYDLTTILSEIVAVVDDCLEAKLTPILAFQGQRFKDMPNDTTRAEMIAWWETVATELSERSDYLAFNLIIETTDGLKQNPTALNDFYEKCVPKLKSINPDRVLIVCPCMISAPERLNDLKVPDGCMVESHFYASGQSRTNLTKLWTTGTPKEKQLVLNKIDLINQWKARTGIKVWVGAIMFADFNSDEDDALACSYTVEEQIVFATFVNQSLRDAKIPYAVNSDTKFFDRVNRQWRTEQESVLSAILTTSGSPQILE